MKYKLITTLLLIAVISLTACGGKDNTVGNVNGVQAEIVDTEKDTKKLESTEVLQVQTENQMETEEFHTEVQTDESTESSETTEKLETAEPKIIRVKKLNQTLYSKGSAAIRKGDSVDYEKISSVSYNVEVDVSGQAIDSGWYFIKFRKFQNGSVENVFGFLPSEYLSTEYNNENESGMVEPDINTEQNEITEQGIIPLMELNQIMYSRGTIDIRKGDSMDYQAIGTLSPNQEVLVIGQSLATQWYQIQFGGKTAFVPNNYLSEEKPIATYDAYVGGDIEGSIKTNLVSAEWKDLRIVLDGLVIELQDPLSKLLENGYQFVEPHKVPDIVAGERELKFRMYKDNGVVLEVTALNTTESFLNPENLMIIGIHIETEKFGCYKTDSLIYNEDNLPELLLVKGITWDINLITPKINHNVKSYWPGSYWTIQEGDGTVVITYDQHEVEYMQIKGFMGIEEITLEYDYWLKQEELERDRLQQEEEQEAFGSWIVKVDAPDGYVNFRTGPGTDYNIITPINNGIVLEVYETDSSGKWLKVYYKDKLGWVSKSQVSEVEEVVYN